MNPDGERQFDIIIYGASGFTGKYVVEYVSKIYEEEELKWAIAGRNVNKLKKALEEAAQITGKDVKGIPVFAADTNDPAALADLCRKTKLLLTCVGPYRFYGEPVVKACVENSCHYIDVCGEPAFLEGMQVKYHEEAQKAKVYVLGSAGFDCIPCETGIQYLKSKFNGDLNSVESFLESKSGPDSFTMNIGTWLSAIHGFANRTELRSLRATIFPKTMPKSNHTLKSRGVLFFNEEVQKWCLTFPTADKSVVNRTQYYNYHQRKMRPVQMKSYLVLPSIRQGWAVLFVGLLMGLFCQFKFGRYILEKFPSIFSLGTFSKHGPTRKQVEDSNFIMTFVGRGYDENLKEPQDQHTNPPNKKIIVTLEGPDASYVVTAICAVQAAITVLKETDKLPEEGGVFSPGAALLDTSLISRLMKQNITYKVMLPQFSILVGTRPGTGAGTDQVVSKI